MAFKMTKTEITRVQKVLTQIEASRDAVNVAVASYNSAVIELSAPVDAAISDLNEVYNEMYGIFEDIHAERSEEFNDKSERWQESEAAENAQQWLEEVETFKDLFSGEIDMPETAIEVDLSEADESLEAEIPTGN